LPVRGERLGLFWVGQLQVAGFLICSIIGLAMVPAGRAIVLAYTMPLWAIPRGLFLWPESLGRSQAHRGGDRLCRSRPLHEPGPGRLGQLAHSRGEHTAAARRGPLGAGIVPLPPVFVAFAVLGPDLLAAHRQHRTRRSDRANRGGWRTGALVARACRDPRPTTASSRPPSAIFCGARFCR
jgi:hypothetical protein